MSQPHATVAVIVMSLIAISPACFAGSQPPYSDRSVEELKLMTIPELAGEARRACRDILSSVEFMKKFSALKAHDRAKEFSEQATRAQQYLKRVGLVIRDKQGGQMPAWFDQLSGAALDLRQQDCDAAATAGGWRPQP
jgi:hypothetical protein